MCMDRHLQNTSRCTNDCCATNWFIEEWASLAMCWRAPWHEDIKSCKNCDIMTVCRNRTVNNKPLVLWLLQGSLFVFTATAPFTPPVPVSTDRNGLFAADTELSTTCSRSSATSSLGVADADDDSRRSANGFDGGSAAVYNEQTGLLEAVQQSTMNRRVC